MSWLNEILKLITKDPILEKLIEIKNNVGKSGSILLTLNNFDENNKYIKFKTSNEFFTGVIVDKIVIIQIFKDIKKTIKLIKNVFGNFSFGTFLVINDTEDLFEKINNYKKNFEENPIVVYDNLDLKNSYILQENFNDSFLDIYQDNEGFNFIQSLDNILKIENLWENLKIYKIKFILCSSIFQCLDKIVIDNKIYSISLFSKFIIFLSSLFLFLKVGNDFYLTKSTYKNLSYFLEVQDIRLLNIFVDTRSTRELKKVLKIKIKELIKKTKFKKESEDKNFIINFSTTYKRVLSDIDFLLKNKKTEEVLEKYILDFYNYCQENEVFLIVKRLKDLNEFDNFSLKEIYEDSKKLNDFLSKNLTDLFEFNELNKYLVKDLLKYKVLFDSLRFDFNKDLKYLTDKDFYKFYENLKKINDYIEYKETLDDYKDFFNRETFIPDLSNYDSIFNDFSLFKNSLVELDSCLNKKLDNFFKNFLTKEISSIKLEEKNFTNIIDVEAFLSKKTKRIEDITKYLIKNQEKIIIFLKEQVRKNLDDPKKFIIYAEPLSVLIKEDYKDLLNEIKREENSNKIQSLPIFDDFNGFFQQLKIELYQKKIEDRNIYLNEVIFNSQEKIKEIFMKKGQIPLDVFNSNKNILLENQKLIDHRILNFINFLNLLDKDNDNFFLTLNFYFLFDDKMRTELIPQFYSKKIMINEKIILEIPIASTSQIQIKKKNEQDIYEIKLKVENQKKTILIEFNNIFELMKICKKGKVLIELTHGNITIDIKDLPNFTGF